MNEIEADVIAMYLEAYARVGDGLPARMKLGNSRSTRPPKCRVILEQSIPFPRTKTSLPTTWSVLAFIVNRRRGLPCALSDMPKDIPQVIERILAMNKKPVFIESTLYLDLRNGGACQTRQ